MLTYDFVTINYAAGLGILFLLVFLHQNGRMEKKVKKTFYLLVWLELLEMLVYSAELVTATLPYPTRWRILYSVVGYSVRPFLLYIILCITLRNYPARRLKLALVLPAVANVGIVSTAFFSGISFSYTEQNKFVRGPLGYTPHIVLAFYLLVVLTYAVRQSVRHRNFEQVIIYIMSAVITASVVVEAIFFVRNIGRTSVVLCTVFYYMFFQTEEYKRKIDTESREIEGLILKNQLDPMTNLLNKKAFSSACRKMLEKEKHASVAFLFMDLDNFKRVNDTLGHAVGDIAILDAARKIAENFRASDVVCRFGGDEFCVCLYDISREELRTRLAVSCAALRQEYWNEAHTVSVWVTASIGAVLCSGDSLCDYDSLIVAADQAVYEAKSSGRNRYVLNDV